MGGTTILTIISALLLLLAFPPFNLFPLAFIAPLFFLNDVIHAPNLKSALKKGALFGLVFMGFFHVWMFTLTHWANPFAIISLWAGLILYLSLFYTGFAGLLFIFRRSVWIIPILWAGMDYLRSLGPLGNPSGTIGYSQTHFPAFLQLASIGGIYFLTFLCLSITTLCLIAFLPLPQKPSKILYYTATFLVIGTLLYGYKLYQNPIDKTAITVRCSVVQPNDSQDDKLKPELWSGIRDKCNQINQNLLESTAPTWIFWPETITPGLNLDHPIFMYHSQRSCELYNASIIFGTPILKNKLYYNSIAAISKTGRNPYNYDKLFLMPFGEYWPGRKLFYACGLRKIIPETDFTKGFENRLIPLQTQDNKTVLLGPAICLESLYPWFFRDSAAKGAGLLYTAVNNAWFFSSSVAEKHVQMTVVRAVENNRFTLQSANTGISAIISPKGEIIQSLSLNTFGTLTSEIPILTRKTPYSRIKEYWLLGLTLLSIPFLIFQKRRTQQ